jgi:hypothetical protein
MDALPDGPTAKSTGRRGSAEEEKGVGQAAQSRATAIRKATSCLRRCRRLCCIYVLPPPPASSSSALPLASFSATLHRRRRLHRLHLRKQLPRLACLSSKLCYPSHRKAQDGCPDQMFDPHMEATPKFMLIVSFFLGDACVISVCESTY